MSDEKSIVTTLSQSAVTFLRSEYISNEALFKRCRWCTARGGETSSGAGKAEWTSVRSLFAQVLLAHASSVPDAEHFTTLVMQLLTPPARYLIPLSWLVRLLDFISHTSVIVTIKTVRLGSLFCNLRGVLEYHLHRKKPE